MYMEKRFSFCNWHLHNHTTLYRHAAAVTSKDMKTAVTEEAVPRPPMSSGPALLHRSVWQQYTP